MCCMLEPPSLTMVTIGTTFQQFLAGLIFLPTLPHPNSQPLPNLSHARNLYDLNFAEFSFSKQSLLRIDIKYRDHFLVDYIHGFNSSTHVYFVTVQRKNYLPGKLGHYKLSSIFVFCHHR